jgi:hypothetical protein
MEKEVEALIKKVEEVKKKDKVDLSSDEDLSIALMNLVSIEEHLYFSGMKTNKESYFELLNTVREMRKKLLARIVKNPEGEQWCISKHLLAASMRLIEVGTKHLAKGEKESAYQMFRNAFDLYSLFWGINLGLIKSKHIEQENNMHSQSNWRAKLNRVVKKILDCCKE